MLEGDLPLIADQTLLDLTAAIPTASGRGFLPFSFPPSQPSGGGKTPLYAVRDDM